MNNIYYLSDFIIQEKFKNGEILQPFRFEYTTNGKTIYTATHCAGEYNNCKIQDNDTLLVTFDNHNLGVGEVNVTRYYYLSNDDFKSGIYKVVQAQEPINIVLSLNATDIDNPTVEVLPIYAKGDKGDKGDAGLSAYEVAVENGFKGTEKQFIDSLSADSKEAAAQAQNVIDNATMLIGDYSLKFDVVSTAETARAQAERTRDANEGLRKINEDLRVSQENTRKSNEVARVQNESTRNDAESERQIAETARKQAESTRKGNEDLRINTESQRVVSENSRKQAETNRVNAETSRVNAEKSRVNAESARVSAEAQRATTFNNKINEANTSIAATNVVIDRGNEVIANLDVFEDKINNVDFLRLQQKGVQAKD